MKNSLNITSLAIVKEVSDRLYLLKEDITVEFDIGDSVLELIKPNISEWK